MVGGECYYRNPNDTDCLLSDDVTGVYMPRLCLSQPNNINYICCVPQYDPPDL